MISSSSVASTNSNTMRASKQDTMFHKLQEAQTLASRKAVNKELRSFFSRPKQQRPMSPYKLCVNDSQQQGKSFWGSYSLGEVLGEGVFANVFTCQHKGNKKYYAVKEISNEEYDEGSQSLKQVVTVMKALYDCPHVVRLHDVFTEEAGTMTYLIMERLSCGELLDALYRKGSYNESDAKEVSQKLLEAVAYCHKKGIAHRYIRPESIFLVSEDSDTDIKLCNFGRSKLLSQEPDCLRTMIGSMRLYNAPEIYENESGYDQQCDLWSSGVVIYLLLCGHLPADGESYELPALISKTPKDLIRKLLVVDPKERYTAHQALNGNWLRRDVPSRRIFGQTKAPSQVRSSALNSSPIKAHSLSATCA
jgi:serine/threonine protein kinase